MEIPTKKLATGALIPVVSLSCNSLDAVETKSVVENWLQLGGRGIDTSPTVVDENPVGNAIKQSTIDRKDIFLTTQIPNCNLEEIASRFESDLTRLDTDYVDLLLRHKPKNANCTEGWVDLEEYFGSKRTLAIGVSGFTVEDLQPLLESGKTIPHVNQIDLNIYELDREMIDLSDKHNIMVQSRSPLGDDALMSRIEWDPVIQKIAENHEVTTYQVAMKWIIQHGWSTTFQPIQKKLEISDADLVGFTLTRDEMRELNELHQDISSPSSPPSKEGNQELEISSAPSQAEISSAPSQAGIIKVNVETKNIGDGVMMPVISLASYSLSAAQFLEVSYDYIQLGGRGIEAINRWGYLAALGKVISKLPEGVDRKDLFLTLDINCNDNFETQFERSLQLLKTDYVDLLLLEDRGDDCIPAWTRVEEKFITNQARSIGVKHFKAEDLLHLLKSAKINPHVHTLPANVLNNDPRMISTATNNGMIVQSTLPFGVFSNRPNVTKELSVLSKNSLIQNIADYHQVTVSQVAMKWILQHGWMFNFYSEKIKASDTDMSSFTLSNDEMGHLDALSGFSSSSQAPLEQIKIETKMIQSGVVMPVISIEGDIQERIENWLDIGGRGIHVLIENGELQKTKLAIQAYAGKIDRKDIFLTATVNCKLGQVEKKMSNLQEHFDYVDLLILHNPGNDKGCLSAWVNLEQQFVLNQARAIGVKDFETQQLKVMLDTARVVPHVYQLDLNIFKTDIEIIDFLASKDIPLQSYSPFGSGLNKFNMTENLAIQRIVKKYQVSDYQVAMKWILQHGWMTSFGVVPELFEVRDVDMSGFQLTYNEMKKLDGLSNFVSNTKTIDFSNANSRVCGTGCVIGITSIVACLLLIVGIILGRRKGYKKKRTSDAANAEHVGCDGLYKDFPTYNEYPSPNRNPPFGLVYSDFPRKPIEEDELSKKKVVVLPPAIMESAVDNSADDEVLMRSSELT